MTSSKVYTLDRPRYDALAEGGTIQFGSILPGLTKERLVWVKVGVEGDIIIADGYLFDVAVLSNIRFSV